MPRAHSPSSSQCPFSHDVQECHPPVGSMGEGLWITLQNEGVTAYRSVGSLWDAKKSILSLYKAYYGMFRERIREGGIKMDWGTVVVKQQEKGVKGTGSM